MSTANPMPPSVLPRLDLEAWTKTLHVMLQVEIMTEYLWPLVAPLVHPESKVKQAQLLDGKPGHRAVIQYEFAETGDAQGRVVLGKVYAEPSQAVQVHHVMDCLWHESFAHSTRLGIPRPLGVIPELSMLVYLPAHGYFLDGAIAHWWQGDIADSQAADWMALAGEWLAILHHHRFALEKCFQLTTELVNLAAWAALVKQSFPETAPATARILEYLQAWATRLHFSTQTPIHKDFHYQHIIVNRVSGTLTAIDFDEMRLGDPAFDLAHFCVNLHLLSCRQILSPQEGLHQVGMLHCAFLNGYARRTGWVKDERFHYFCLYTRLKIAKQLCTGRGPHPRPTGEEQRRQVHRILEDGENGEW